MGIPTNGLVLYAPLYSTDLQGSPITSKDANQHSATVTGAIWTPQGRTFTSALSHKIVSTIANFRSSDSSGTIWAWIKVASDATNQAIFSSSDEGTNTSFFTLVIETTANGGVLKVVQQSNNDTLDAVLGTTNVGDNAWHLVFLQSSGTAWSMFVDGGAAEGLTVGAGANTGDWFADTALRDNFSLGNTQRLSATNYYNGTIGELGIMSRDISASERSDLYNTTVKTYKACWGFFTWA